MLQTSKALVFVIPLIITEVSAFHKAKTNSDTKLVHIVSISKYIQYLTYTNKNFNQLLLTFKFEVINNV